MRVIFIEASALYSILLCLFCTFCVRLAFSLETKNSLGKSNRRGPCLTERNHYFQHHCYFIKRSSFITNYYGDTPLPPLCKEADPAAEAVAVETIEENDFVVHLHIEEEIPPLLTSGYMNESSSTWAGWNSTLEPSILKPLSDSSTEGYLVLNYRYDLSPGNFEWEFNTQIKLFGMLCEVPYLPENTVQEVSDTCWKAYDTCHDTFCCGADSSDRLWFHCSTNGKLAQKPCLQNQGRNATWECVDGSFLTPEPDTSDCGCYPGCEAEFQGRYFKACPGQYAYASCFDNMEGTLRWFCSKTGKFSDSQPESSCCVDNLCSQSDPFLQVWQACQNETLSRVSKCPKGHRRSTAIASWTCGKSGFVSPMPDYSACDECEGKCSGVDSSGEKWTACWGEIAQHPCPEDKTGTAFWLCRNDSKFENNEPDLSQCLSQWIIDVNDLINDNTDATTVMINIHNHVKDEVPIVGIEAIIGVVGSDIQLFKNQSKRTRSMTEYEEFVQNYVYVFNDIMRNTSDWANILNTNREVYVNNILQMSEDLGFSSNKIVGNVGVKFTKAFVGSSNINFSTSYIANMENINFSHNRCSIKVDSQSLDNGLHAAVAIVFPFNIGSTLFPTLINSKNMNSDVFSFSIADVSGHKAEKLNNISTKFSFKHSKRSREPAYMIVPRRLHDGEIPTPVIGASVCSFYDHSRSPNKWMNANCTMTESSAEETNCTCNHLSSFAVLVDFHDYQADEVLEILSISLSTLSVIALTLTLAVLLYCRDSKKAPTPLGRNFCCCLLISHVMFLTLLEKKFFYLSDSACRVVGIILHFILLSSFFWTLLEAYQMCRSLILVFDTAPMRRIISLLVGYGIPALIVIYTEGYAFIHNETAYGRDELCWLRPRYIWAFDGPVFAITGVNVLAIGVAIRTKIKHQSNKQLRKTCIGSTTMENITGWLKGLASVSSLLGVTWLVGLALLSDCSQIAYLFVILNGLQGVFIFIFHCAFKQQFRSEIMRIFRNSRKDTRSIRGIPKKGRYNIKKISVSRNCAGCDDKQSD